MTPNDIATNWIAMKDFCRCCRSTYHQQQLAQAYLALEARIQKLELQLHRAKKALADIAEGIDDISGSRAENALVAIAALERE